MDLQGRLAGGGLKGPCSEEGRDEVTGMVRLGHPDFGLHGPASQGDEKLAELLLRYQACSSEAGTGSNGFHVLAQVGCQHMAHSRSSWFGTSGVWGI